MFLCHDTGTNFLNQFSFWYQAAKGKKVRNSEYKQLTSKAHLGEELSKRGIQGKDRKRGKEIPKY